MRSRRNGGVALVPRRRFGRRRAEAPRGVVEGTARIDRRTKNLLHRIRPGDVAVILHEDLDAVAAEGLVERGVAAVLNLHRSISGRYPNAGPLALERAQVPLVDSVGEALLDRVADGDRIAVSPDGAIWREGEKVGQGTLLSGDTLERALNDAQAAAGEALEAFVRNTMEYLQAERDLVLEGQGMPEVRARIGGRPAVVVVRGSEHRKDLRTLRGYIRDVRPVIVAVDGAADAVLEEGLRPDVIIGDMDSVSTGALTCGAELVVHAYPDGRAPGLERLRALGLEAHVFASAGTSEDIALLLAYEKGADLIVAVGGHDNMVEFLDKGRAGMASTFLVRLRVGPKLVDAKRVNRLYRGTVRTRDVVILIASAAAALVAAAYASPGMRLLVRDVLNRISDFFAGLF